ncbi:MAG: LptF/LptG family permease, partial [Bacteroidales bacterium]|nr:LptF/LptG family permease [Bacteroidales bacterium]
ASSALLVICIIFDLSERIDDFLSRGAPAQAIIFDYYVNFVPYFFNMIGYLFIFIAVIFFTSRLASRSEIIAILNGGVNFWRFLVPYIATALLLGVMLSLLANFVIPHTNAKKREFEKVYYRKPYQNRNVNIHMQVSPGTFVYVESFNVSNKTGNKFALEKFENDQEVYKITSPRIEWRDSTEQWYLFEYVVRTFDGEKETFTKGNHLDTVFGFKADEFAIDIEDKTTMDYFELNRFINKELLKGASNAAPYLIEKYQRMMYPLVSVILTLIGVSLSSRKKRGAAGMNIAIGITLSFLYIMLIQFSSVFSMVGNLPPFWSVMLPNVFYALIAAFLVMRAQK